MSTQATQLLSAYLVTNTPPSVEIQVTQLLVARLVRPVARKKIVKIGPVTPLSSNQIKRI